MTGKGAGSNGQRRRALVVCCIVVAVVVAMLWVSRAPVREAPARAADSTTKGDPVTSGAEGGPLPASSANAASAGPRSPATREAAVSFVAPSLQAAVPGDVDIELSVDRTASGWVEIEYDPTALVLADVTARYEIVDPGRVRVDLDPQASGPTRLTFSASAPGVQTNVHLVRGASADGTPLDLRGLNAVEVRSRPNGAR